MPAVLLFPQLPFEINEKILYHTGNYGLNVKLGYEHNIKHFESTFSEKKMFLSIIRHNIDYLKFYKHCHWYFESYLLYSIKWRSDFWYNKITSLKYYYLHRTRQYLWMAIRNGDIQMFEKCLILSRNKDKYNKWYVESRQKNIFNVLCRRGYVKMFNYFIENYDIKPTKTHLEIARKFKRKRIVKAFFDRMKIPGISDKYIKTMINTIKISPHPLGMPMRNRFA